MRVVCSCERVNGCFVLPWQPGVFKQDFTISPTPSHFSHFSLLPLSYSGTPLPMGQKNVSILVRCPELFLGKEKVSILERCPYFRGLIHAITLLGGRRGVLIAEVSLERGSTVPIKTGLALGTCQNSNSYVYFHEVQGIAFALQVCTGVCFSNTDQMVSRGSEVGSRLMGGGGGGGKR